MKKFIIATIILFLLGSILNSARAMVFDPADFTYVIHLYYDGKKFVPNTGTRFQYDVIGENFEQPTLTTDKPYRGKIISIKGETLASFVFDPKYVDTPIGRGPLDVKAPYFGNAKTINFFDDADKPILSINVGETSVCNENNICEAQAGEDHLSCPSDCTAVIPVTPVVSVVPLPAAGNDYTMLIVATILVIAILSIWWLLRRRNKQSPTPPVSPPNAPQV